MGEIGYLSIGSNGGKLFFQIVDACHEKCAIALTSDRSCGEWGSYPLKACLRRAARTAQKGVSLSERIVWTKTQLGDKRRGADGPALGSSQWHHVSRRWTGTSLIGSIRGRPALSDWGGRFRTA
ncbi:ATP-binding protein [Paraburkholderia strydomiana]|uniref:ATP-binding protein n=1 Tax=Paraburkholderia strydomiana TaxID=1245417 RepID=A0ABW9CCJ8_9BURK